MNKTKIFANVTKRYISSVKRKFPINREEEKSLPTFDYGVSKKNYRRMFAWGNIRTGALGIPFLKQKDNPHNVREVKYPKRVGFGEKHEVTSLACGFGFSIFSVNSNDADKLYGSGINTDAQIGYHEVREGKPLGLLFYPKPIKLPIKNPKTKILKLSAGRAHSIVVTDEEIYLFGNNAYGQCGRKVIEDENYNLSSYINRISTIDGKKIVSAECGQDHSLLLMEDGSVYSCGWGADGQTGQGHYNNTCTFARVKGDIESEKIVKLSCRADFVLALSDQGEVFGWGNTEYGQMSLPNDEQQLATPTLLKICKSLGKIKDIASGGTHCLVLNENHEVFTWGFGLLGSDPDAQFSYRPMKLPEILFGKNDFQPDTRVEKVVCGIGYSAAVTNNGDLYSWGRNRYYCLGFGNDKDQYFPFRVGVAGLVQEVYCGVDHSIALCKPYI